MGIARRSAGRNEVAKHGVCEGSGCDRHRGRPWYRAGGCARAAEKPLRAARGAIVTIASTRALMSEPNTESYAATKGGLVALTHALAISLGPDVRVNCVSPGWIVVDREDEKKLRRKDHAQHPVGRVGKPGDIAEIVAFLI